jgi:hypothetical protein
MFLLLRGFDNDAETLLKGLHYGQNVKQQESMAEFL